MDMKGKEAARLLIDQLGYRFIRAELVVAVVEHLVDVHERASAHPAPRRVEEAVVVAVEASPLGDGPRAHGLVVELHTARQRAAQAAQGRCVFGTDESSRGATAHERRSAPSLSHRSGQRR